jgi:hypothetical protein
LGGRGLNYTTGEKHGNVHFVGPSPFQLGGLGVRCKLTQPGPGQSFSDLSIKFVNLNTRIEFLFICVNYTLFP